ncbi:MAG: hypothetical protein K2P26_05825 [Oscillospiraceae bacterium]|jgi:predicted tellurium resistance membrane protein TerC|nr:hypothetical protein [Oscillospiraceae bacterium]
MKPKNTDGLTPAQRQRRKNAVWGAVMSSFFRLLSAAALLWLRASLDPAGFVSKLMLIIIVLDLGSVPLIWISLRTRLKEIQGGEEDAAAQY